MIVTVLYKYICFGLRATVGCFIASDLANLPQRLFLNVTCGIQDISRHILATAHVKSQTQAEFELVWCLVLKAFAGRSGLVLMFVGKAGWYNLWGYRWTQEILKNYRWARSHKFVRQKCRNCTFSRQKYRNCAFSRQNSVCSGSSLSVRPFAIEESGSPVPRFLGSSVPRFPGSPVPWFPGSPGKSRLVLIFTPLQLCCGKGPCWWHELWIGQVLRCCWWPTPEM